jgi:GNAT superfamily N-acetyltransferase
LFCDVALAAQIEQREAQLMTAAAAAAQQRGAEPSGFVIPVCGGVATFAGQGSPFNKVAGLGFGGVPAAPALGAIEAAFAACGAPVQVELAHLGDPAIGALLTDRGYRLTSFENVLGVALADVPEPVLPPGLEVRRSRDGESESWLAVVTDGFAHPDDQGVLSHERFPHEVLARAEQDLVAAGAVRYVALRDGVVVGAASLRLTAEIAQLTGAATAPVHRRQGVQTALLSARLADARAAGCTIAVVAAQPGSRSQQNAQRRGFDLLYVRAVLVKDQRPLR